MQPKVGDACERDVADSCGEGIGLSCVVRSGEYECIEDGEWGTSCQSEADCHSGHTRCVDGTCEYFARSTFSMDDCKIDSIATFTASSGTFSPTSCEVYVEFEIEDETGGHCDQADRCVTNRVAEVTLVDVVHSTRLRLKTSWNDLSFSVPMELAGDTATFVDQNDQAHSVTGPAWIGKSTNGAFDDEPMFEMQIDLGGLDKGTLEHVGAKVGDTEDTLDGSIVLSGKRGAAGGGGGGGGGGTGSTAGTGGGAGSTGSAGISTLSGPACTNPGGGWFCVDCQAQSMSAMPFNLGTSDIQVWGQCAAACAYYDASYGAANQEKEAQANLRSKINSTCYILEELDPKYSSACAYCNP